MIAKHKTVLGLISSSIFFLILSLSAQAWAHFLWIENPPEFENGKETPIKIYFGEYHEGLREVKGGRLDERKGTELRVVRPSGDVSEPLALQEGRNSFNTMIAPTKGPGFYDLVATDAKSPVVDYSKYDIGVVRPIFYTRTSLLSFQKGELSGRERMPKPVLDLDILPLTRHFDFRSGNLGPNKGEEIMFQVFFKEKPFAGRAKINIYAPNGWIWKSKVNSEGIGRFAPLWPGLYVVDVVYKEKASGTFIGKDYEAIRHRATLSMKVNDTTGKP